MNNLRWIISGFALGLVLSVAPSCGPAKGNCTPSNCASGCCDANGQCQPGVLTSACGTSGGMCSVCQPTDSCSGGFCIPIGSGGGSDSGTKTDGGTDGGMDAGSGCNASNCAGCCSGNTCVLPSSQTNLQCGNAQPGAACTACVSPLACNTTLGACQDTTCTNGCVNSAGQCVPPAGQSTSQCGFGGLACVACQSGQTCQNGQCVGGGGCSPANCSGCCVNGQCQPGTSTSACGVGGGTCSTCSSGQTCSNGQCTGGGSCSPSNCSGCCLNGVCQPGNSTSACGTGGQICSTCASGQSCTNGTCQTVATAQLGDPCTTDSQCSAVGFGAICKKATSSGNATYSGGYCTRPCTSDVDCPTSLCVQSLAQFGEGDSFCGAPCSSTGTCRTGYECYGFRDEASNQVPTCWIDPPPTPPVAPSTALGSACTSDTTCQGGGTFPAGFCLPQSDSQGTSTGWTGGYCMAGCSASPSTICGTNGACSFYGQQFALCLRKCSAPGSGQSTCRPGYVCTSVPTLTYDQSGNPMAGPNQAVCVANCNNTNFTNYLGCPTGTTCQANGYCI